MQFIEALKWVIIPVACRLIMFKEKLLLVLDDENYVEDNINDVEESFITVNFCFF